jgi:biofilm PGA synthesis protein PgaD
MSATSEQLQIDAPELLTGRERTRDAVFTALMWGVYLYLWVPLVSLFAWLLGFEFAYDVMIRMGGARDLGSVLIVYAVIVVVILATVAFWSLGNRLRYGKLTRRHAKAVVTAKEMADYFAVDEKTITQLRSTDSATIVFDADGRPVIEPRSAAH